MTATVFPNVLSPQRQQSFSWNVRNVWNRPLIICVCKRIKSATAIVSNPHHIFYRIRLILNKYQMLKNLNKPSSVSLSVKYIYPTTIIRKKWNYLHVCNKCPLFLVRILTKNRGALITHMRVCLKIVNKFQ